mgnify:CR=1 FL=1
MSSKDTTNEGSDLAKSDSDALSGLEREIDQISSGKAVIHQRTLKRRPQMPQVQAYIDKFGHGPAVEAYKFLTSEEIEAEAAGAIERGEPIASWRDRHKIKTGTTLDGWYG